MKKILILFLALGLLGSCSNKKGKDTKETTSGREKDDYRNTDQKENEDKDKKENMDNTDNTTTTAQWPQKDRDDFMSSCVREAEKSGRGTDVATRYCQCMLEKMEMVYPDVNKLSTLTDQDIQDVMTKYRDGCLDQ